MQVFDKENYTNVFYTENYFKGMELEVRLFSDLHLEFDDSFTVPNLKPNQVLVFAGDVHVKGKAVEFFKPLLDAGHHVFYLDGNHDFYRSVVYKVKRTFKALEAEYENFHYLDDTSVFLNDVEFLGGTLWTDMNKEDPMVYTQMSAKKRDRYSDDGLWDYRLIYVKRPKNANQEHDVYNTLTTLDTVRFHKKTVQFLKSRANADHVQFVATHHTPDEVFMDYERHGTGGLTKYAYFTDLSWLTKHFDYWAAGHTHKKVNEVKNGTHFLSHPRGYHGTDDENDKVSSFDPNWVLKVPTTKNKELSNV
jgi:DNA repair exonuclease SbcCD nuclease subunit